MSGRGHKIIYGENDGINWGDYLRIAPEYTEPARRQYERRFTLASLDINELAIKIKLDEKAGKVRPKQIPSLGDYKIGEHGTLWVWLHSGRGSDTGPDWHIIPGIPTVEILFQKAEMWKDGFCYRCNKKVLEDHYCSYMGRGYGNL